MEYWEEVISEACDEAQVSLTREQLQIIAKYVESAHEYYGEAHGHYCIPNPQLKEIEKLEQELERESTKITCKDCKGTGEQIFHGPAFTSSGSCHWCNGTGFIYNKY